MKTICLALFSLGVACLHAGIKIPNGVFELADLEIARAKATAENLSIVWVLTNTGST